MVINSSWFLVINILVIVFIALVILNGIRKGFIMQVVDMLGLIFAIFVAFVLAPTMGASFSIVTLAANADLIDYLGNQLMNIAIWFIIIVIAVKLLLFLIKPLFAFVTKLPIIHSVNKLLGGVFGLVVSLIWIIVFTTFLLSPMFDNGKEVVNGTILKPLDEVTEVATTYFKNQLSNSKFIQDWVDELKDKGEAPQSDIIEWLLNNKFDIDYEE